MPVKGKIVKTRYRLSKKDTKKLFREISAQLGGEVLEKLSSFTSIEKVETRLNFLIYLFEGKPILMEQNNVLFPTVLYAGLFKEVLPVVIVDMGAVPHVVNGADVMAPGIRSISKPFNENATVLVADEEKQRIFCVGLALMSSDRIFSEKRGRAIKNLHHVKDKMWDFLLSL
ncbi:MAG: RNA-binding protein [Thermoprotei archaeon]|nr:MAG: RNA-binding protein [Thermoprotei archaeon]